MFFRLIYEPLIKEYRKTTQRSIKISLNRSIIFLIFCRSHLYLATEGTGLVLEKCDLQAGVVGVVADPTGGRELWRPLGEEVAAALAVVTGQHRTQVYGVIPQRININKRLQYYVLVLSPYWNLFLFTFKKAFM
jgi:hypothetical protein